MADLPLVTIQHSVFPNFFSVPAQTMIGDILVQCAIEQRHADRLEVTEHPVQAGASITDHSYKRPAELVLTCGWSNSSFSALKAIASGFFNGGSMSASDFVSGIYSQLLALQQFRQPVSVITIRRKYDNMLMTSLELTTDKDSAQALMVEASFRQVIIVNTSSTKLPPDGQSAHAGEHGRADRKWRCEPHSGDPLSRRHGSPVAVGCLVDQQGELALV